MGHADDVDAALDPYGWSHATAAAFIPHQSQYHEPCRVLRVDRIGAIVIAPSGTLRCAIPRPGPNDPNAQAWPATGDWAVVDARPGRDPMIVAVLPRTSVIRRRDPEDGEQVLAANVDYVFVVHGLDRPSKLSRLERTLVLAWESGATPVAILTKADIVDGGEDGPGVAAAVADLREVALGVDVWAISNLTGHGVDHLAPYLAVGKTVVLIGESGAGKSSLVNRLLGEERQAVEPGRKGDYKGRHTTTVRELIPLPAGGVLIDTPGMRSLGLWAGARGVSQTFADVVSLASECRFRDCAHGVEPGCAVREAIRDGRLDGRRLASYRKLQRELAHEERRQDQVASRAEAPKRGRAYHRARKQTEEW